MYAFAELNSTIPEIKPIHEGFKQAEDYKYRKVILLVRDPRDVLVSRYFGGIKSGKLSEEDAGKVSEYILRTGGHLEEHITFYNAWKQYRDVPRAFLLVRYEDMKENPHNELRRVMNFIGLQISNETISNAVGYASFDNMRKMEQSNTYNIEVFQKTNNAEVYKIREGKAGNYKKHLDSEAIAFIEKELNDRLYPDYGYNYFS